MSFVETEPLEDWRRRHGNQYGTPAEVPLVQQADAMYTRWLDHPIGRGVLRRTTLGAFWPESDEASEQEVGQAALRGVEALQRGGHITVFAERMHEVLASEPEKTSEAVRRTRENLPLHARLNAAGWRCTRAGTRSTKQPCHMPLTPTGPGNAGPDPFRTPILHEYRMIGPEIGPYSRHAQ